MAFAAPAPQPWPGQRVPFWRAAVELAPSPEDFRNLQPGIAAGATLTAGDDFYVITGAVDSIRDGDTVGQVNWVLKAASGSATVEISQAFQSWDDFGGEPAWGAPSTVTAAAPRMAVAVPLEQRTVPVLRQDDGVLALRVRVIAGTLAATTLGLQAEPPQGLQRQVGVDFTPYMATDEVVLGVNPGRQVTVRSGAHVLRADDFANFYDGGQEAAQAARVGGNYTVEVGGFDSPQQLPSPSLNPRQVQGFCQVNSGIGSWSADAELRIGFLNYDPADLGDQSGMRPTPGVLDEPSLEGRDWVDLQWADGDTVPTGWRPIDITYAVTSSHAPGINGRIGIRPPIPSSMDVAGPYAGTFPPSRGAMVGNFPSGTSGALSIVPPGSDAFALSVWTDVLDGAETPVAGGGVISAGATYGIQIAPASGPEIYALLAFQPPDARYGVPVWGPDPDAIGKGRAPRFYVTYTEVDDDPRAVSHVVGIGKPADDHSVFRVPTPLGTLRELRHGEKVSDVSVAYPLRVKLFDGSWTTVAAMTPDP